MLTLVILMHLRQVQREYPDCSLLQRVMHHANSLGVDIDQLQMWGGHVRDSFVLNNAEYLPMTELQGTDAVIPFTHIATGMQEMGQMMRVMNRSMLELAKQLEATADENRRLTCEVARLARIVDNMDQQQGRHSRFDTNGSPSLSDCTALLDALDERPPSPVERTKRQRSIRSFVVVDSNDKAMPIDWFSSSLKQTHVHQLFHNWYTMKLHSYSPPPNTEAKRRLAEFARDLFYYKRFLQPGTTIPRMPSDNTQLAIWMDNVGRMAAEVQVRIQEFLQQRKLPKKQLVSTCVQAVLKQLNNIPLTELPDPEDVADYATEQHWNLTTEAMKVLEVSRLRARELRVQRAAKLAATETEKLSETEDGPEDDNPIPMDEINDGEDNDEMDM